MAGRIPDRRTSTGLKLIAGRSRGLRALGAAAVIAASVVLSLWNPVRAAPPNQLVNPNVWPSDATTKATFTFAVSYKSAECNEPTSVTAVVGTMVIPLTLEAGTPADGRYRGSAKLPAGTEKVMFHATAQHRNDPNLSGPTIRVHRVPVPSASSAATPKTATQSPQPRTVEASPNERTRSPRPSPEVDTRQTQPAGSADLAVPSARPSGTGRLDGGAGRLPPLVSLAAGALIAVAALALLGFIGFLGARRPQSRGRRPMLRR